MTGTTTNEGYPYPLTSDFADAQDAFRLASAIDTNLRAEQAPFRSFMGRPSFVTRQLNNASGFTAGSQNLQMDVIEWDNTGGALSGAHAWSQPLAQQPSWWMFGGTIMVVTTGTPVVGDMNMGNIQISTTDQVTGLQSESNRYQRNDDTQTGGEWINIFAMAPIYQGQVSCRLFLNGSTAKAIQQGSRFWGMYLGPVT